MIDVSNITPIRPEEMLICMDCGKTFADPSETSGQLCARCFSANTRQYEESKHENINIEVPDGYSEHPMETKARELFNLVTELTNWREEKVRLWFSLPNPLLGEVSPEWMLMHERSERLEKFIREAIDHNQEYRDEGII